MNPGQNIRNFRKQRNLSQKRLAEMVNISPSYLCDVEKGRCNASLRVIVDLAVVLQVNVNELLIDSFEKSKM